MSAPESSDKEIPEVAGCEVMVAATDTVSVAVAVGVIAAAEAVIGIEIS